LINLLCVNSQSLKASTTKKENKKVKRLFILLSAVLLVFGLVGAPSASPVPFKISDSSLSLDWDWALGDKSVNYTPIPMSSPEWLDEGQSTDITFGEITFPSIVFGQGTATFGIDFSEPDLDVAFLDDGDFFLFSFKLMSGGYLEFGDPEPFSYSYAGVPGGIMTIDFDDIIGVQLGNTVSITGSITNNVSPVPEPATMLLLGSGLIGISFVGRKKLFKG
jgi:hypothetical protein